MTPLLTKETDSSNTKIGLIHTPPQHTEYSPGERGRGRPPGQAWERPGEARETSEALNQ